MVNTTNTSVKVLPGYNLNQSAKQIKDLLLSLNNLLGTYSSDEILGLIQAIVDLMKGDEGEDIGQQLTNAIAAKSDKTFTGQGQDGVTLPNNAQTIPAALSYLNSRSNTLATGLSNEAEAREQADSSLQANIENLQANKADTNSVSILENTVNEIETLADKQLTCLNGYTRYSAQIVDGARDESRYGAAALVSQFSSCIILAERDCVLGLKVTDSGGKDIQVKDTNNEQIALQEGHLYVIDYSESGNSLTARVDIDVTPTGQHWQSGTAIAHTQETADYDIEGETGDMYLNTETLTVYRCTGVSARSTGVETKYDWYRIGQWYKVTGITYDDLSDGLKAKIDNAGNGQVDDALSFTSNYPVANKVIAYEIDALQKQGIVLAKGEDTPYIQNFVARLDDPSMEGVSSKVDVDSINAVIPSFVIRGCSIGNINVPQFAGKIDSFEELDLDVMYYVYRNIIYNSSTKNLTSETYLSINAPVEISNGVFVINLAIKYP